MTLTTFLRTCASYLVAALFVSFIMIETSVAQPQFVRAVEGIAEFRLENGMQVLLFPDPSRPTVTVNVTIFVGSRHEGYGEAGMAHLLEHMVFKGTPTHPAIPADLAKRGARFNGTTWLDRTNYYETLNASDENLEFALKMEADRMVNSLIRAEDLASEMTVVRNEFERGENSPQRVLMQRMTAVAFDWHNYGKSTIGNRADIERVPVENLRRFYQRFYQPDNAMLIIAGKFDVQKAMQLTQQYFGALPRPDRELDKTYTEEPAQDGERLVTVRRVGEVPMAGLHYHLPAGGHPDFAAVDVLTGVLAGEPSGRLYESLVKRRIAASMYGTTFAAHDPGSLILLADAAQGVDGGTVLQALIDTVEGFANNPIKPEEVERARQELLKQRELRFNDSSSVAVELSDWAAQGDWRLYFLYRDRLEAVTADDVQRVAVEYLQRSNRTAGLFEPTQAPERTAIPETPNLQAMIGDYKGREEVAQGEDFDASPAAIEARLERETLTSGIKVTLLPKKTRGNSVIMRLTLRYGNLEALTGKAVAAEYLGQMLMRGTENMTRQQISDELDNYRTRMSVSGSPGNLSISIQTTRENLVRVMGIMEEVLRRPTFPAEELELIREEQISGIGQQLTEPTVIASNAVQKKISPYSAEDPRFVASMQEELERAKAVTVDQVRDVYNQLVGASVGELTIVGDFDADKVLPVVDRITNGWKSNVAFERLSREAVSNETGTFEQINTPDKANAAYFAALTIPISDDHPDYPALAVGNFILGANGLSSRLGNRIRQKDGLSYTVQSNLQAASGDPRAVFYIFAISNPDNAQKVHLAVQEELDRLLKDGITAEELEDARKGYLQQQEVRRTSDRSLASMLESLSFYDRDLSFVGDFESKVAALTVEDVNSALRKHIQPQRLYTVSAGDFAKGPAAADAPAAGN